MEAQKAKEKSCLKGYLAAKKRFKMLKQRSKSVLNCIWNQILIETNHRKQLLSMQD